VQHGNCHAAACADRTINICLHLNGIGAAHFISAFTRVRDLLLPAL
jgi:hypothetical protein